MTTAILEATAADAPAVEVSLTAPEWEQAAFVALARIRENWNRPNAAHYDAERMEPDLIADTAAAVAEYAVARHLNLHWTGGLAWTAEDHHYKSKLADVGENTEVRRVRDAETTTFAVAKKDADRIIAVCYVEPPHYRHVRILGYISGKRALSIGRPAGYGDRVRVPIAALRFPERES